ncbi:hypothetical protein KBD33_03270 [Candidatus Gracilibacteria bacterium]|nr:hypothetical protein [Candidatus Gracilibacteria bacterium]
MDYLSQSFTFTGHEIAAWISVALIFVSTIRYIDAIIKRRTLPNIVGWLLYELSTLCVLLTSFELGSMSTIFASSAYMVSQTVIIGFSIRYGYSKMHRTDYYYFGVSIISLILWGYFALNPEISESLGLKPHTIAIIVLITNTLIDLMGAVSIFTKLYLIPESEDSVAWFISFLSGVFSVLAIEHFTIQDIIYPIYLLTSNLAIWFLCFRKKPRFRFRIFFHSLIDKIIPTNR